MSKPPVKDAILEDGLRYKTKVGGSPFRADPYIGAASMSCFLCGKHRPRQKLQSRKLIGKSQFVCAPNCKSVDED